MLPSTISELDSADRPTRNARAEALGRVVSEFTEHAPEVLENERA